MKPDLNYNNSTVHTGMELFDDGTEHKQGHSIKAGRDIHVGFATNLTANLYDRKDVYAKTVRIVTKMEEDINTSVHHLAEIQTGEKHIKYALSQE